MALISNFKKTYKKTIHNVRYLFTLKTAKKAPYYFATYGLALAVILILGLLSFGGMMALMPLLPLGLAAFALAVAYEGEIYLKNIQNALKRINIPKFLQRTLANQLLHSMILSLDDDDDCPQFFIDYKFSIKKIQTIREELDDIYHDLTKPKKKNNKVELKAQRKKLKKELKQIEYQLKTMEKYFAANVFSDKTSGKASEKTGKAGDSHYRTYLRAWIAKHVPTDKFDKDYQKRRIQFFVMGTFSLISGAFMAWGTTFMLSSTFAAIPIFAGLAAAHSVIIPLALIAGLAWSFLVFNSVTELLINETFKTFFDSVKNFLKNHKELLIYMGLFITFPAIVIPLTVAALVGWKVLSSMNDNEPLQEGSQKKTWFDRLNKRFTGQLSPRSILSFIFGSITIGLTIAFSIFIAATFFSTGLEPMQVMTFLSGVFQYICAILMAITIGISEFLFAFQNTMRSFDEIQQMDVKEQAQRIFKRIGKSLERIFAEENWLQIINPIRLIINLTFIPARICLFLAHLASIGAAGDKVPGMDPLAPTIAGTWIELVVDKHYFDLLFDEEHDHDYSFEAILKERLSIGDKHNHEKDLPTKILHLIYLPLVVLATLWDFTASQMGCAFAVLFNLNKSREPLSLSKAYKKQAIFSKNHHHNHHHKKKEVELKAILDDEPSEHSEDAEYIENSERDFEQISSHWYYEALRARIERFQEKATSLTEEKKIALEASRQAILEAQQGKIPFDEFDLDKVTNNDHFSEHRHRFFIKKSTRTEDLMDKLGKNFSFGG